MEKSNKTHLKMFAYYYVTTILISDCKAKSKIAKDEEKKKTCVTINMMYSKHRMNYSIVLSTFKDLLILIREQKQKNIENFVMHAMNK